MQVKARSGKRRRRKESLSRRWRRWRKRAAGLRRRWRALPAAWRGIAMLTVALAMLSAANLVYQVVRKPTEMFFPADSALKKTPAETWREYGGLFRKYATATMTPDLLAALAQVEAAGNPVARTYWRWRLTWRPFAIYQPASSAVGMYQMTDPAFADAQRYCIRDHVVVDHGCWLGSLYSRVFPGDAVELATVYLQRNVDAILGRLRGGSVPLEQRQELATIVHLCGAGPAEAFARNHFHLVAGDRCGDHQAAAYLAKVDRMKRLFRRLAAEQPAL